MNNDHNNYSIIIESQESEQIDLIISFLTLVLIYLTCFSQIRNQQR